MPPDQPGGMVSFAQNHEDVVLARAFSAQSSGFYIDVGAWHPTLDSVTRHFYDQGWHGVNVEPSRAYHALLESARPRDVNLHLALSDVAGEAELFETSGHGLSTLSPDGGKALAAHGYDVRPARVEVDTLASVCDRFATGPIDFLKIDAEGLEERVIRGADWRRHRPRVLVVEAIPPWYGPSQVLDRGPEAPSWESILAEHDYEKCYFDGINRFYVAREAGDLADRLRFQANPLDRFVAYRARLAEIEREEARARARMLEARLAALEASARGRWRRRLLAAIGIWL